MYTDAAYATDGNWKYLCGENGYGFVTSFKCNTRPTNNGCAARGAAARLWCSLPYDEWVRVSGYGTRWKCECVFSDIKRMLGETVTARSEAGMIAEVEFKIRVFNGYKAVRAGIIGVSVNGVALV